MQITGPEFAVPVLRLLGDGGIVLLALGGLVLGLRGRVPVATALLAGGVGLALWVSDRLKHGLGVARPCHEGPDGLLLCPPMDSYSLPSNHATLAGALATAWIALALLTGRRRWWHPVVAAAIAVGVAAARVLGGVHTLLDVTVGLLLGVAVVGAVVLGLVSWGRWIPPRSRRRAGPAAPDPP